MQHGRVDLSSIYRLIRDDRGGCLLVTILTGNWLGRTSGNSQASNCGSDTADEGATGHFAGVLLVLQSADFGHSRGSSLVTWSACRPAG